MTFRLHRLFAAHLLAVSALFSLPLLAAAQPPTSQSHPPATLDAAQAQKLLPGAVFFAGQSAPTQLRNSTGVRFPDGRLALAILVDSSGYSGGIQQKYQGYLFAEVPLDFAGHKLPIGAYGIGMVQDHFLVMNIAGHQLFQAQARHDAVMRRPVPLQTLALSASSWRLCFGRDCVEFRRAQ